MKIWLYDCEDLKSGKQYRELTACRLVQIMGASVTNLFRTGPDSDMRIVKGQFVVTRHREDLGENHVAYLWQKYPQWCQTFAEEWTATCRRLQAHG